GDHFTVGTRGHREQIVGSAAEVPLVAAVVDVPELDARVAAGGQEQTGLAEESKPSDLLLVCVRNRAGLLALLVIPDLDRVVRSTGSEQLAVRLPTDVEHMVRVPFERLEELARRDLPHLHELVGPAGRELG